MLLPYCSRYYINGRTYILNKKLIKNYISKCTKKGIRVIMISVNQNSDINNIKNQVLVGIMLIKDEIRKEAKEGVKLVKNAHINTVMITGDNKDTAINIAKESGILCDDGLVLTSEELNKMSDDEVKEIIPKLNLVARSLPTDKSRLVKLCQEMNYIVGMTGDGVNDAPALKRADVGFSMGSGTEVAKEASDIVILDDNFLSISRSAALIISSTLSSISEFIKGLLLANKMDLTKFTNSFLVK